jgi:hypothetical protein
LRTIYKYNLDITDQQIITTIPGEVVHVGLDPANNIPCIWVDGFTDRSSVYRTLWVVGTGNFVPTQVQRHIGSFRQDPFIWHVYE